MKVEAPEDNWLHGPTNEGRQWVFRIDQTWIVRIFETHDGFRQPATFFYRILTEFEQARAHSEPIRHHGIIPDTPFHYAVTKFVEVVPLMAELCASNTDVRVQITAMYRILYGLPVPDTVGTVEEYMQPRIALIHERLASASLAEKVEEMHIVTAADRDFCMVVSHGDLASENILARPGGQPSPPSICVIDYICPRVSRWCPVGFQGFLGNLEGSILRLNNAGLGQYPEELVWTERLCIGRGGSRGTQALSGKYRNC
ncbi:hypothetical protein C8J57DRAFT_1254784 [Mycena rebaudengoi]|nr:hypothetical protein C8J57DRAFT_1254784 [Mycena rebaudengoi]